MTNKMTKVDVNGNGKDYVYINAIDLNKEESVMDRLDRLIDQANASIEENEILNTQLQQQTKDIQAWLNK